MLVVARELKQEAHTCLSCHCSWPAPGSLRRSCVCERLWLRPPLLSDLSTAAEPDRSQHYFHAWPLLTSLPPTAQAAVASSWRPVVPGTSASRPPNLLFMALWHFLSMCVFSGPSHMFSFWIHIMWVSAMITTQPQRSTPKASCEGIRGHGTMW